MTEIIERDGWTFERGDTRDGFPRARDDRWRRLTYVERRALMLRFAADLPGWDCIRLVGDKHIGRVLTRNITYRDRTLIASPETTIRAGTIVNLPQIDEMFAQKQKAQTMRLPK